MCRVTSMDAILQKMDERLWVQLLCTKRNKTLLGHFNYFICVDDVAVGI